MPTYSRVRVSGFPQAWPCHPSATCGPDVPRPRRTRPPESRSSVATVAAVVAGERAGICMIAVPSFTFVVRAPTQASGETASEPYASDVHTEWNPHRSASSASPTQKAGSSYPSCNPTRIRRS